MTEAALKAGPENWYRNDTWSVRTELAFLTKLNRTRGQGPQCLAIQISHLADGSPEVALRLTTLYFEEWSDPMHDGSVHMAAARAHVALGAMAEASTSYAKAVAWQALHPEYQIGAELAYAMHVAEHAQRDAFAAAQAALDRVDRDTLVFPLERFRLHCAHALISDALGDRAATQSHARCALAEATPDARGLHGHPDLGRVPWEAAPLLVRLKRLAQ
ncbi:MAG: hypothetical protein AAGK69_13560 [Pseudomonadota bacterium]